MQARSYLTFLPLLCAAMSLPAQTWLEAGDAGQLPPAAQVPLGTGALLSIQGTLGTDVDLYLIQIDAPVAFSATTVGGATFDTQLFLFDERGRGITACDDVNPTFQSTVTGQYVPAPGRYLLAVSCWDIDPVGPQGQLWVDGPTERAPDGPARLEAFVGWNGNVSTVGSSYTIALTGASFPGKRVVLPDNHHLAESSLQLGSSGSTSWWRAGGGRFQLLYEGSHFQSAGVAGSVQLRKLLFRTEDGEVNLGGASWSGAIVQVGATTLTAATMSTTFATNRLGPATIMGPSGTTTVTMQPSLGSTPNNDSLVVDLAAIGAAIFYDPTGQRPNLLVDITLPTPANVPAGTAVPAMQDTTGGLALVRGRGIHTGTSGAVLGTDSLAPPVLGVEFQGSGGNALVVPATNEFYGAACGGSAASFYQAFANGQAVDMTSLVLVPNDVLTPTFYQVQPGSQAVSSLWLQAAPDTTVDDGVVSHNLGFPFRFPGGVTTAIGASTNGFVWLDGVAADPDFSPTVDELLGVTTATAPRVAPFWFDFDAARNAAAGDPSGLHVVTDTSGGVGNRACYITWWNIAAHNTVTVADTTSYRMQCVLRENGTIEFRYGAMPRFAAASTSSGTTGALVGFSRGRIGALPSVDPQSRDLSVELPFTTSPEGAVGNMGQTVVAGPIAGSAQFGGRAFAGQSLTWNVANVPAGAAIGVQLLDVAAQRPGFQMPTITAPGCMLSTTTAAVLWDVQLFPPSTVVGSLPLLVPPGLDGATLHAQYVVLGGLTGGPDLISVASNAIRQVVGRR